MQTLSAISIFHDEYASSFLCLWYTFVHRQKLSLPNMFRNSNESVVQTDNDLQRNTEMNNEETVIISWNWHAQT